MSEIFVFGSNLKGIHGKGAALCAVREHGAIMGKGLGLHGNSYAIPTKDNPRKEMKLVVINIYVAEFICHADCYDMNTYNVTPIGCGLAGYKPEDIAPMFRLAKGLTNVNLPPEFLEFL